MQQTPSGLKYVRISGRYLKGTANGILRGNLYKLPVHAPFGVICPHDSSTEVLFRMVFDMVEVSDGLIKAYSERAMLGINEDRRFQVRIERNPKDKPHFILMDGKKDVVIFDVDSNRLKPAERDEIQDMVKSYIP